MAHWDICFFGLYTKQEFTMIKDIKFYYVKVGLSFFFNWGFITLIHYRMGRWIYLLPYRKINPLWYIYLFINFFLRTITKMELPPTASIGKNLYLPHPYGLVMAGNVVIGNNCTIGPWVVIGHLNKKGNPVIGDHVYIGPKASILGNLSVGNGSIIGAHALVVRDVPDGVKVYGVASPVSI